MTASNKSTAHLAIFSTPPSEVVLEGGRGYQYPTRRKGRRIRIAIPPIAACQMAEFVFEDVKRGVLFGRHPRCRVCGQEALNDAFQVTSVYRNSLVPYADTFKSVYHIACFAYPVPSDRKTFIDVAYATNILMASGALTEDEAKIEIISACNGDEEAAKRIAARKEAVRMAAINYPRY